MSTEWVGSFRAWDHEIHMRTFGDYLVTQGKIQRPQSDRVLMHKIRANVAFRMFQNILTPVTGKPEVEGYPDLSREVTATVAYQALFALCRKLYDRCDIEHRHLHQLSFPSPAPDFGLFPVYVTALIDSFGPIKGLHGAIHIPYLLLAEVEALKPQSYDLDHKIMFDECYVGANLTAAVLDYQENRHDASQEDEEEDDSYGYAIDRDSDYRFLNESPPVSEGDAKNEFDKPKFSAWWTFHVYENESPISKSLSLWSPVAYDDVESHVKLGVAFAGDRLTEDTGIVCFSASPYYSRNQLRREPHALLPREPSACDFPDEASMYPCLNGGSGAVWFTIEKECAQGSDARDASHIVTEEDKEGAMDLEEEHHEGEEVEKKDEEEEGRWRIIGHYFNHCLIPSYTNEDAADWALKLNDCDPAVYNGYFKANDKYQRETRSKN